MKEIPTYLYRLPLVLCDAEAVDEFFGGYLPRSLCAGSRTGARCRNAADQYGHHRNQSFHLQIWRIRSTSTSAAITPPSCQPKRWADVGKFVADPEQTVA